MKRLIPHFLVICTLGSSCAPISPPPRSYGPASARKQTISIPVARQRPLAPRLKRLENGHYRVRKPWLVELNGRRWLVPAGYSTNGITAPQKLKKSLGDGVDRPETWAAIFHDWLFTQPGISRAQADGLFYDLLIAYGVPQERAKLMYTTVKLYSISKSFR